jgi:uncharacterized protein YpiB (UPF0302 family)
MEKSNYLDRQLVASLLSEIMIEEQVRLFRKQTLYKEIDEALAMNNREKFLVLTNELREILAYEKSGTA